MTEDEKKNLREHFLEPETRCGTYISSEMKAVWKAQMDILEVVIGICKKHNIKYFLTDGSLLGAIRHGGYIPWDDDIDVSMLRPDYDRFCVVARKELQAPYFFQNGETDSEYSEEHAKIRNSETTAVTAIARRLQNRYNQGIFVDVFPLDNIPCESKLKVQLLIQKLLHNIRSRALTHAYPTTKARATGFFCRLIFKLLGHKIFYRMGEYMLRRPSETGLIGHRFFPFVLPKEHWRIEWFSGTKIVPFEYLEVAVPAEFENVLEWSYGDWHEFVKGASFHSELYFNPYESYKTVIPRELGYKV